ncbi:MAG: DUF6531 domain-containing protein [Treponema sp.]|nr:DUF6531 domain-containing protein [Treponema sp.]
MLTKGRKVKSITGKDVYIKICSEERKAVNNYIDFQKSLLAQTYSEVSMQADITTAAYNTLGAYYASMETSGDPVSVSSGEYILDYDDYVAQDFLDKFTVSRKLTSKSYTESFGYGWSSSLDSRILRSTSFSFDYEIESLRELIKICEEQIALCDDYINKYPNHPDEEIENAKELSLAQKEAYEERLAEISELEEANKKLIERNHYADYGRFSSRESSFGSDSFIIYIEEDGNELPLQFENGVWTPLSQIAICRIKAYSLDSNGNISNSKMAEGGYLIEKKDGKKRYFSKYGILEKEVDRKGNKTIYESTNGRITSITLKTGEKITVGRNSSGYITMLSGPVSGKGLYSYSGSYLQSFTDSDGVKISYTYDGTSLSSIKKADNTSVEITYETNNGRKIVSSVKDENGHEEFFSFDFSAGTMRRTSPAGRTELYRFDSKGNLLYARDAYGSITEFDKDSSGIIISVKKDGKSKFYNYDNFLRPVEVSDSEGGVNRYEYNAFNQITKAVDADGFSNTYNYDSKGNLLSSYFCGHLCGTYWYYPNGLLKGFSENGLTVELEYNSYGSVCKKTERDSSGKVRCWLWRYDSKNRPVYFKDPMGSETSISYGDRSETITEGNKKKLVKKYDLRNRLISSSESSLLDNTTYTKSILYDGRNNIRKVFLNGKLFAEYYYNPDNQLKAYDIWNLPSENKVKHQAIRTDYTYDNQGRITKESRSCISDSASNARASLKEMSLVIREVRYEGSRASLKIYESFGSMNPYVKSYDNEGRLIKKHSPDGYEKSYAYSKAGRLKSINDTNHNVWTYVYKSDGSLSMQHKNAAGYSSIYEYFPSGLLEKKKDSSGTIEAYSYDAWGNLLALRGRKYLASYTYDKADRELSCQLTNLQGKSEYSYTIEYDDEGCLEIKKHNSSVFSSIKRDVWNRIIEESDVRGHYNYFYDVVGNCIKSLDDYGNQKTYEYAPYGLTAAEFNGNLLATEMLYDPSGRLLEKKTNNRLLASKTYDNSGHLIEEVNSYGAKKSFSYDNYGNYKGFYSYDNGESIISKQTGTSFSRIDANGSQYKYSLNPDGSIASERNPLGKLAEYKYDSKGRIIQKKNFSGRLDNYTYDDSKGSVSITFGNGEYACLTYNSLAKITGIKNQNCDIEYIYDDFGNLLTQEDKLNGINLNYSYDNFGRCIRKEGPNFSINYTYDNNSRVTRVEDTSSGVWISFLYDSASRISRILYSSGMVRDYGYNSFGENSYIVTRDRKGLIIAADFIVYDSKGRVEALCDKNGKCSLFSYDQDGRLISSKYPYSEELFNFYREEAENCGLYVKTSIEAEIENSRIPSNVLTTLQSLLDKSGSSSKISLSPLQKLWQEDYSYSKNGSLISLSNALCTIRYEYDSMNRLLKKTADNTDSGGISFIWNDDGCLQQLVGQTQQISFSYSAQARPTRIEYQDKATSSRHVYEYKYDSLGRRSSFCKDGGDLHALIYDGLSSSLICDELLMKNGALASSFYSYNEALDQEDYRTITNSSYSEYGSVRTVQSSSDSLSQSQRPYHMLGLGGELYVLIYHDGARGSYAEASFIVNNFRGRQLACTDELTDGSKASSYDVWGNCISSDCRPLDFKEIGYRDYNPFMKSFTSKDPAEIGGNLFAYCACDPLNYFDSKGFAKTSYTNSQNAQYAGAILQFTKFDGIAYLDGDLARSMGIYLVYDCADTSTCIDYLVCKATGLPITSDLTKNFGELYEQGLITDSKWATSSAMFNAENGATQVREGYDRDYLRVTASTKSEARTNELNKKATVEAYLRDPNSITPGTCLVWRNSDTPTAKSPESCGHVATVLSRQYDENGNVAGFVFIQGHTGGSKTELCFMSTNDLVAGDKLDWYMGAFSGIYETENSGKEKSANAEKAEKAVECPSNPSATASTSSVTTSGKSGCGK